MDLAGGVHEVRRALGVGITCHRSCEKGGEKAVRRSRKCSEKGAERQRETGGRDSRVAREAGAGREEDESENPR